MKFIFIFIFFILSSCSYISNPCGTRIGLSLDVNMGSVECSYDGTTFTWKGNVNGSNVDTLVLQALGELLIRGMKP